MAPKEGPRSGAESGWSIVLVKAEALRRGRAEKLIHPAVPPLGLRYQMHGANIT